MNLREVAKNLWQSGMPSEPLLGWDMVVNLTTVPTPLADAPLYVQVPMDDGEMTDLMGQQVRALASLVNMHLLLEKMVLVHCNVGWNRSGVVVARALIGQGFTGDAAILACRARERDALSNPHFEKWLRAEGQVNEPSLERHLESALAYVRGGSQRT